jgi:hypothetical protein
MTWNDDKISFWGRLARDLEYSAYFMPVVRNAKSSNECFSVPN